MDYGASMTGKPGQAALKGQCTTHFLAEILRDLYFQESTGTIRITGPDEACVSLHFDRGMLFFAESDDAGGQLETHLFTAGVLPEKTVAKLRQTPRTGLEKASALVAKKILTKEALAPAVRSLVEACIVRAFSWPTSRYEFTAAPAESGFFDSNVLFTFESILKGILRMSDFTSLKEVLLRQPGRIRLGSRVFVPVQQLALKPQHGYVLSRADGSMRMDEIALLLSPGDEEESLQFLYGLAVLGVVEFDPPASEGLFSLRQVLQRHYEAAGRDSGELKRIHDAVERLTTDAIAALGLTHESTPDEAKKAYQRMKNEFRKEHFSERVAAECRKELTFIERKLGEVFLRMQVGRLEEATRPRSESVVTELNADQAQMRREMVKSQAQEAQEQNARLAENYLVKAREFFNEKDYHNCIQFCRLNVNFAGESGPALTLMAEALAKNPNSKWQRMAEDAWVKACELEPWNAEYRVNLGLFYQQHGFDHRARRQFEMALEIIPGHQAAREAMSRLGKRR